MHEMSIAAEILDVAQDKAGRAAIRGLSLRVGALSGVFVDSLLLYIDLIAKERDMGTVSVTAVPEKARFRCSCGQEYEVESPLESCPTCAGPDREPLAGMECCIESIEVENE